MSRNFNYVWRGRAYDARANVYELMGDYDRALADYTKSIELDTPDNRSFSIRALHRRGRIYHQKGDYDRAIAEFTILIEVEEKYSGAESDLYMARGEAYLAKGDYNRALADFTKSIERYGRDDIVFIPDSYSILDGRDNPYERRGYTYLRKGDFDNAIADFTKVLKFYPAASRYL